MGAYVLQNPNTAGGGTTNTTDTNTSFTGTDFTLSNTPTFIYGVFVNGQRVTLTVDYTILGAVITFLVAKVSDSITVVYRY